MTKDVVTLTKKMPDPLSVIAGLLSGGPDQLVGTEGEGAVVQLCDQQGRPLVSVEAPLLVQVRGEAERLLGASAPEVPYWWTEARATTGVKEAEQLARHLRRPARHPGRRHRLAARGRLVAGRGQHGGDERGAGPGRRPARRGRPHRQGRGHHPGPPGGRDDRLALGRLPSRRERRARPPDRHPRLHPPLPGGPRQPAGLALALGGAGRAGRLLRRPVRSRPGVEQRPLRHRRAPGRDPGGPAHPGRRHLQGGPRRQGRHRRTPAGHLLPHRPPGRRPPRPRRRRGSRMAGDHR